MQIADPQVRCCGTIGGNVGGGDPANDMPALMQCLDASFVLESAGRFARGRGAGLSIRGRSSPRSSPAKCSPRLRFALPPAGHGHAYKKLKRKIGDYATAAAAVILEISGGKVQKASIALTNLGPTPLYANDAVARITGSALGAADVDAAVAAAEAMTAPVNDGRGSVEYRRRMAGVMVRRALIEAASRAGEVNGRNGGVFGWLRG